MTFNAHLRSAVTAHPRPSPLRALARKHAAVAIVLRPNSEVLLVERAQRQGDRWSGHVALPGGLRQAEDDDLVATAMRETREEVGLALGRDQLWGGAAELTAVEHRRYWPMTIAPFVFGLEGDAELVLGDEVRSAFWFPLGRAAAGDLDGWLWYRRRRLPIPFRCWRYAGREVWGLTYGILRRLVAGAPERHIG